MKAVLINGETAEPIALVDVNPDVFAERLGRALVFQVLGRQPAQYHPESVPPLDNRRLTIHFVRGQLSFSAGGVTRFMVAHGEVGPLMQAYGYEGDEVVRDRDRDAMRIREGLERHVREF